MERQFNRLLVLTIAFVAHEAHAQGVFGVTVVTYNYAGIRANILARARVEAGRIYGHAGIAIAWLDCPIARRASAQSTACDAIPGPTTLAIRILPQSMGKGLSRDNDSFGMALYPEDGGMATIANIFGDRIEALATTARVTDGVLLGHVLAHEIGHLLLGRGSHSASGIMQGHWDDRDLVMIAQGTMLLTVANASAVRDQIRARTAYQVPRDAVAHSASVSRGSASSTHLN